MLQRSPRPARRRHGARPIAVLAELVALGLGVAANLAAVWDQRTSDPAQVWAGGAIPAVLLLGTYLFLAHRVPVVWSWSEPGWLAWWANLAAGAAILVPVALASYWHQRELLLGPDGAGPGGTPVLLATLLPLTVDGLAVRAALTLWARPTPSRDRVVTGGEDGGSAGALPASPSVGAPAPADRGWGPPSSATTPPPAANPAPAKSKAPAKPRSSAPLRPVGERKPTSTQRLRAAAKARGITQKGKRDSQLRAEIAAHDAAQGAAA